MDRIALVFVGGGLGAVLRHLVNGATLKAFGPNWPAGTLTVNVVGGLAMGLLAGALALRGGADQERWRLLLGVGVLGGFTTFSAFSLDAVNLIKRGDIGQAGLYAAASVALSIAAVYGGLFAARRAFS